ncbi:MAG: indolepyruvate ferredoxin oxidoreductase family protein [Candidatus Rokubacteria bacterium]|nr:indolepyruvate ferredoxin oxidoreductase family protein [Candidatus Rokubacteria bacterium]
MTTSDVSLDSKYRVERGRIFLSGIQALVRVPIDQHRADRRRGLDTATLISGYPGSPLGGFDLNLQRNAALLAEHQVHFVPGLNEELGATVVWGGQLSRAFPRPKHDGVLGMWYGKTPGLDRTGDLFRHANLAGVGPYGGVLAISGDDPVAKSTTFPTASELTFYDLMFPVLYPGNVQEVLDLGRLGFELSRYSGSWVGFKIVTNVSDEVGTAEVDPERIVVVDPGFEYQGQPWRATHGMVKFPPWGLQMEHELVHGRLEAARAFGVANGLNRVTVDTRDAWLGIAAAGKTYHDLREALAALGLDDEALRRHGIRLLHLRMPFPLAPDLVREFARGLQELLVIEEKRSFIEMQIREVLADDAVRPRIVGKRDADGRPLVPAYGELDADAIALLLARRLEGRIALPAITAHAALLEALRQRPTPVTLTRGSWFCSGCPHNRSTVVPEGSIAGGGIGCHSMAMTMDRQTLGVTQMGGEGAHWVGAARFTETPHFFQNLGDGTFAHSGSLAIRQAVAAGVNITFKILYNGTVAMTGGQDAAGTRSVPDLTRVLEAEGVGRVLVLTDEPGKYPRDARWAPGVEVWRRERLDEAQRLLRDTPGVTALIYDQHCAAEKRRLRKRGRLADPERRVLVNEAVCEGCGDCGVKSNCVSVQPVETAFGRKTQIHRSSCNKDYSCLDGECPSFVTFMPRSDATRRPRRAPSVDEQLPDPVLRVPRDCHVVMTGIGGTGVVTLNQILGTAALIDGRHVRGLDQTGLSQKNGPVVSHLKITDGAPDFSNKVASGGADCYLALDLLVATAPGNLDRARPERTVAVISTGEVATGAMVASPDVRFPDRGGLLATLNRVTRKDDNVVLDAVALAEALFDNHMMANPIVLGTAYQAGAIPVSAAAIEQAFRLNGVAVEANTQAFRAGRRAVADPAWAGSLRRPRLGAAESAPAIGDEARRLIDACGASAGLRALLERRVPELIAYQDADHARRYVEFVGRVAAAERAAVPGETRLVEAVARYLFKLMAYKDEYEVARLHLDARLADALGREYPDGVELRYHLKPPLLQALGLRRKLAVGRWIEPLFRVLVRLRRLRGTAFDPFGHARVRRVERELIGEYRGLVEQALAALSPDTHERAVTLASLPDAIRGYEDVKLRAVARFRAEARALGFGPDAGPR